MHTRRTYFSLWLQQRWRPALKIYEQTLSQEVLSGAVTFWLR
jgi:hypothetical protein